MGEGYGAGRVVKGWERKGRVCGVIWVWRRVAGRSGGKERPR